ncbi:MAG: GDSL-type esterase/lipase family protein [Paludibacteraceae bacterium]|nr:GDSL-type esterase/lipase family protein [Paludibacteraceae bacterium]
MGILGIDVYTTDPYATISFDLNSTGTDWNFSRLRLLADINDSVTTPLLAVNGDTIEGKCDNHSYVFECGEGSTSGTLFFRHKLDTTRKGIPEIRIMGFIPENDRPGLTYHSLGVNGAALWSWLRCYKFDEQIGYLKPDLVILGVGINDANVPYSRFDVEEFKEQYRRLLGKIYEVSPECAVVFVTNNDCVLNIGKKRNKPINQNTPKVEQAMRELAREQGAAVWNQYQVMGGYGSSSSWVRAGLMCKDRIHFTAAGYNLLGELLYKSIMETGESWNF